MRASMASHLNINSNGSSERRKGLTGWRLMSLYVDIFNTGCWPARSSQYFKDWWTPCVRIWAWNTDKYTDVWQVAVSHFNKRNCTASQIYNRSSQNQRHMVLVSFFVSNHCLIFITYTSWIYRVYLYVFIREYIFFPKINSSFDAWDKIVALQNPEAMDVIQNNNIPLTVLLNKFHWPSDLVKSLPKILWWDISYILDQAFLSKNSILIYMNYTLIMRCVIFDSMYHNPIWGIILMN